MTPYFIVIINDNSSQYKILIIPQPSELSSYVLAIWIGFGDPMETHSFMILRWLLASSEVGHV